jgi:hypothetical protein
MCFEQLLQISLYKVNTKEVQKYFESDFVEKKSILDDNFDILSSVDQKLKVKWDAVALYTTICEKLD